MAYKKFLLFLIVLAPLLMAASVFTNSIDQRHSYKYPIAQGVFNTITFSNGETSAEASSEPINMLVERVDVILSNATNSITADVVITDENGTELISLSSLAENTNHIKLATGGDFNAVPVAGTLTCTITPSGDPGAAGMTCDVILLGP